MSAHWTRRGARLAVLAAVVALGGACTSDRRAVPATGVPTTAPTTTPPPATTTTGVPVATAPATAVSSTPTRTTVPAASVTPLPAGLRRQMEGSSWRPGCPVGLDDLALVTVPHVDLAGTTRVGQLVLHRDQAEAVAGVFVRLHAAGFPIERMQLVDDFGADDDASMAANNTSAFNCRRVAGTAQWSEHAYGRAVDVNPVFNPWVRGDRVDPPAGAAFTDRSVDQPGLIRAGDAVVQAFAAIGWSWGGDQQRAKDYQHFSATGR